MTVQQDIDLVRTSITSFNTRDFEKLEALLVDDAFNVDVPSGQVSRGKRQVRQRAERWARAFSDGKIEINRIASAGEGLVVVELTARGTHDGPFDTPLGLLAPTGAKTDFELCYLFEVKNGKITSSRMYYDVATIARQLQQPAGAGQKKAA